MTLSAMSGELLRYLASTVTERCWRPFKPVMPACFLHTGRTRAPQQLLLCNPEACMRVPRLCCMAPRVHRTDVVIAGRSEGYHLTYCFDNSKAIHKTCLHVFFPLIGPLWVPVRLHTRKFVANNVLQESQVLAEIHNHLQGGQAGARSVPVSSVLG